MVVGALMSGGGITSTLLMRDMVGVLLGGVWEEMGELENFVGAVFRLPICNNQLYVVV